MDLTTRRSNNIYYFYYYKRYRIKIFKTIRIIIPLWKTKNLKDYIPTPNHTLWFIVVYLRVYLSIVFVKAPSHCMITFEVSKIIIFYYYVLITALFTAIFHKVLTIWYKYTGTKKYTVKMEICIEIFFTHTPVYYY